MPVTHLGERLAWTALLLVILLGCYLLMWRGWHRRAARQADVPPLPEPPHGGLSADLVPPVPGLYVSSTTAGDWLDRIVVRDLGVRSRALLRVTGAGVSIQRQGASDLFIPAAWLRGVRRERGMAGKFVGRQSLVVLTWEFGDRTLDTGFLPARSPDTDGLVGAVGRLVTEGSVS